MPIPPADLLLRHVRKLAVGPHPPSDRELLQRFNLQQDEAAFAELVTRHGAMVYRVARRVVQNDHDAEDVFQAAFLVLARKARMLDGCESLGPWLFQVARRVALAAHRTAARRHAHELRAESPCPVDPLADISLREAQAVFDEELARLPERLSAPLVLCLVEGATHDEAARQLGWSLGTLRRRLAQGRALLRTRLERRGLGLSAALLAALLVPATGSATPAAALVETVVRVARLTGTAQSVAGVVSARARVLADGFTGALLGMRAQVAAVLLLFLGVLAAGIGLVQWGRHSCLPSQPGQTGMSAPPGTGGPVGEEKPKPAREGEAPAQPAQKARQEPRPPTDRLGDPLPPGAVTRIGTARFRPTSIVRALAWSTDSKLLASSAPHSGVFLWDGQTGKLHSAPWGGGGGGQALAFSPDGKLLAVLSGNGQTLHVWDLAKGKEVRGLPLPFSDRDRAHGWSVAFSSNSKLLACGDLDGTLSVWEVATGKLIRSTRQGTLPIQTVAFLSRGKVLAAYGGADLVLRDVATFKEIKRVQIGGAAQLVISPDEKLAAHGSVGLAGVPLGLYDLEAGKKLPPFKGSDPGHSLAFLPDSKHLVVTHAGSPGESLRLWDVAARKEVRRFQGLEPGLHPGSFLLAVSPDGKKVAGGAIGHNGLHVWDIATGKLLSPTGRLAGFPTYMAVSPDGKAIASLDHGAWDHVKLWNATTGERLQPLLTTPLGGYGLTYSPDGKMLLVAQPSRPTWRALDTATGKFRGEFEGQSIAFSPDGKWLAAAWHKLDKLQRQSDAAVRLLDAATGKPIREMEKLNGVESKNTGVEALAFSADGKTLLAVVKGKEARWVRVWDSATGKALRDSTLFPREWAKDLIPTVRGIAPDGSVLAVSSPVRDTYTHKVVLCDLASGRVIRSFTAQIHVASCQMVFSPDARIVAVVQGGAVCLHESASGLERKRLAAPRHGEYVTCLTFPADGRTLVAGYYHDISALVWDVTGRLQKGKVAETKVSPARLEELWRDLGDREDGVKAHKAIWELVAAPKQTVPFLKERLQLPKLDEKKVAQWIADLSDSRFSVRAVAMEELEQLGLDAESALRRALGEGTDEKPTLDVRRRVEVLLGKLDCEVPPRTWLQVLRALEVLEQIGTPAAQDVVARIASSPSESRLRRSAQTCLDRLRTKKAMNRE